MLTCRDVDQEHHRADLRLEDSEGLGHNAEPCLQDSTRNLECPKEAREGEYHMKPSGPWCL